jgi:hypothetical protein
MKNSVTKGKTLFNIATLQATGIYSRNHRLTNEKSRGSRFRLASAWIHVKGRAGERDRSRGQDPKVLGQRPS